MITFGCSILCLLQLLSNRISAQWTRDRMLAATGSTIPFPGTDNKFNSLNWDFSVSSRNLPITEVYDGKTIIYEKYKNRIKVNISDGSFQLKDVGKADSGHYKMTVDLDPHRTRILTLGVIDPLSTPSISCENHPENHTAVLNCTVQRGRAASILWSREEVVLPVCPRQSLSDGNVTFTIWNAEKSDSGYYTCSMENQVSRTNSTYQLVIEGHELNPRSRVGLFLTIIVVITVVLVFIPLLVHAWTAFLNK
ncbi:cell surface A33 antigen-like isoform X1 [Amblyraja radiata]|uniref:cell surface A33 antigen-like isoform X1 n=1 Tax=Amblyraja radiata TaxID=386614 RepID=UPI0014020FB2|nr:cell surface A33 antigen-like isoform X1 [Amblyraja radiata]XP_032903600.1 cell surface A33 antigen-like isoform X1 [Amblyraja radiata]XP_032903601.1 cell surface A33 antigen-like isoform X1 [Amblyraja radiata]